jgi:hypothetical protein
MMEDGHRVIVIFTRGGACICLQYLGRNRTCWAAYFDKCADHVPLLMMLVYSSMDNGEMYTVTRLSAAVNKPPVQK